MRLTLDLPVAEVAASTGAADLLELARAAEQHGFGALATSEHPAPSSKWMDRGGHETFDPLVALAYCAAATKRIRLMPLLLVLPYRNPLLTAKAVSTLDVLSQGRLTLVVGAGYLRSEFLALGVDFSERNALFDEALEVLDQSWRSPELTYRGLHFEARGQALSPQPAQQPRPPIWLGGNTARARERAVRLGDGWAAMEVGEVAATTTRTAVLRGLVAIRDAVDDVRRRVADSGGDAVAFQVQVDSPAGNFANDYALDQRLTHLRGLADAGVDHTVIRPPVGPVAAVTEFVAAVGADLHAAAGYGEAR